ncbi:MAG: MarC family protein [Desulfuromonadaceae bacterium]|nr:MarC family protein [Desulfuromonadaceae bacterium]MDD2849092.1 MarC family protein [Desulfuromonadaceae bacterium]MDD4131750.1 MarC family protein [Desulfuromonadaceae bacterium]
MTFRYIELFTVLVVQLFIIVDPLTSVPVFLAITPGKSTGERRTIARRSCIIAFFIIVFFLVAGSPILDYFGITTSAVRICGGILLFIISLELLYGRTTRTQMSSREERLAEEKGDVTVTPLAIPLLAGPGAIATTLVFAGRAENMLAFAILIAGVALVFGCAYIILHWAEQLSGVIGPLGMKIMTRTMGLLLAFIATQYVIDGIQAVSR